MTESTVCKEADLMANMISRLSREERNRLRGVLIGMGLSRDISTANSIINSGQENTPLLLSECISRS